MLYSLWQKICTLLLKGLPCVLCLSSKTHIYSLCKPCILSLPWIERACQGCGLPLADHIVGKRCGPCVLYSLPFDRVKVAFEYKWPCDQFMAQIKFKKKLELVNVLGHLMAEHFKKDLKEPPPVSYSSPFTYSTFKRARF